MDSMSYQEGISEEFDQGVVVSVGEINNKLLSKGTRILYIQEVLFNRHIEIDKSPWTCGSIVRSIVGCRSL